MPQGNRKRISREAGKGHFIKDWGTLAALAGQCWAGAVGWPGRGMAGACCSPMGRDVRVPSACWWGHLGFVPSEPQKAAGTSPARARGHWKTLS